MNNYSIDYDDLKHILDVELKDKSYKNYIIK